MTKMQAYQVCQDNQIGFLANVVLTQHSEPARKLRAMAKLALAGRTVSLASFSMDRLLLDGYATKIGRASCRERVSYHV